VSRGSTSKRLTERAPGAGRAREPSPAGSRLCSLPSAPESTESVSACRVRTFLRDVAARGPLLEFLMEREMALAWGSPERRQQGRYLPMALLKSLMKSGYMMGFMVLLQYPSQVSTSKKPAGTQPQTAWRGDTARVSSVSHLGPDPARFPRHANVFLPNEPFRALSKGFSLLLLAEEIASFVPEASQQDQLDSK